MTNLPLLSVKVIKDALKDINCEDSPRESSLVINFPAFKNGNKALEKLIKTFPTHDNLDEVYLKVVAVNSLYSTNIYDTYKMAYHIHKIVDVDRGLEDGEYDLIEKIARGHKIKSKKGERHFYSFATKYCSFHNPEKYAIYDMLIQDLLIKYYNRDIAKTKEQKINYEILRKYEKFMEVISEFKEHYKLGELTLKEIDTYLWLTGKKEEIV